MRTEDVVHPALSDQTLPRAAETVADDLSPDEVAALVARLTRQGEREAAVRVAAFNSFI